MWAHYADSHRGSVLRFKSGYLLDWDQVRRIRTAELELVPGPESIRYKKHPPVLSGKSLKNVVRETLLTKSTPWRYEGEWRIFCSIAADSARTVVPLPPNCLDGVFIGARAMHSDSDTIISRVRELNTGTPGQLKVFQATLSKSSYAIEFTHIEI